MSYGSESYGGAAEGVGGASFGGDVSTSGNQWSLPETNYSNIGLTAPTGNETWGAGGTGVAPGINANGWDLSGGMQLGPTGYSLGYDDYGPASQLAMHEFGQSNYGLQPTSSTMGLGAQAAPYAGQVGQAANPSNPFARQEEPGFWGSRAQRVMSALAQLNPVTSVINTGLSIANAQDPVKAGIQSLLGTLGPVGQVANTAYGAYNSKDPAGYLGNTAAMYGAGMMGAQMGGMPGAQLGQGLMGEALGSMSRSADTGPMGTGSPMEAGRAQAQAAMSREGAGTSGGGRDWTDTALKIGSGLYGMYQANQQKQLAQQAIGGSAPWTASGGNQVAGEQLKRVMAGDFTGDAGFKAAQLAAARASAQQPGGFAGSAAANAAIKYQMDRMQALGAPAGVGFNPAQGYATAGNIQQQGVNTAMAGMGEIGAGATGTTSGTGMNTMPPWLQQYLINNKMGG